MRKSDTPRRALLLFCVFAILMTPRLAVAAKDDCSQATVQARDIPNALSSVALVQEASDPQLAGEWYAPEAAWGRWMGKSATVYLKTPSQRQATLQLEFYLSEEHLRAVEAVVLTLDLGGKLLDRQKYEEVGLYTYRTAIPREQLRGPMVSLGLSVDRTFQVRSDKRALGLAVFRVGFMQEEHSRKP